MILYNRKVIDFLGEAGNFAMASESAIISFLKDIINKILATVSGVPPLTLTDSTGDNLVDYKIYGNSIQSPLPTGYKQLSYIKATGTQYIDTEFTPNQDTKIDITFTMNDYTGKAIYGSRIAFDNSTYSAMLQSTGNGSSFQYNDVAVTNTVLYTNGQTYHVVQDKNELYVDGTLVNTFTYGNFTCPSNLYLFAVNQNGTVPFYGQISIISCKIYDNGVLVRDYVPCKNSSDVVGLYDIVNGVFYNNKGTGTFVAGTNVPTPTNPIEIKSVGDKTKNLWNSELIAGCMKFADGQYLYYSGYLCNATPISVEAGETYTLSANNYTDPESTSTGFVFYNNGTFVSSLITTSLTVTIPSGVNQLYYNFRKQSSASSLSPSDITNVQLEKGSTATTYEPYGYKIPIRIGTENLPKGYTQLSYIEADGTQYIDTGFSPDANTKVDYKVETTSGPFDASPFFGTRLGTNNNNRFFPIGYLNTENICRSVFGLTTITIPITENTIFEGSFDPQNNVSKINGTNYDISNSSFEKISNNNLYIFATSGYVGNLYLSHGKIYYCKIYNNGVLARNFIPCINTSNVVGLYDTINGQFYPNSGAGEFIAGEQVSTTTNIYLDEPLRKIGDYVDYIDYENQKVIRNVGHIDLGSINWNYQSQNSRFIGAIPGIKMITGNWMYDLKCDIYGTTLAQNYNIGAQATNAFVWDNRYSDPTAYKAAVKGHYLNYALETTSEETVELPTISTMEGDNTFDVATTTKPSLVKITYYKK